MSNTLERVDKDCDDACTKEIKFPYRTVAVSTRVVTRDHPLCRTQPPSPKRFERCACRHIRSADSQTPSGKTESIRNILMQPLSWGQEMPTIVETTQTSFQELNRPETASISLMADIQPPCTDKPTADKSVECDYKPPAQSKTTSFHLIEEEVNKEEMIQKTEQPGQAMLPIVSHQSNQQQLCFCPPSQQLCYCPPATAHHQYQTQCPCGKFHAAIITKIEAPDWSGYEACPYRCK